MYYLGVDLGGTNIAVGVVDENGKVLNTKSTPTLSGRPLEEVVCDMAKVCREAIEDAGITEKDVKCIGIGTPGSVDQKNGVVVYSNNLRMDNFPIAEELRKHIDLPINIENDANAAAYGEYISTGNGIDSFIFVTLGTGVGGGIVLNGEIYRGFNGAGAELGHITLVFDGEPCTCGRKGCWEVYASVTGLIKQTQRAIDEHPESEMCAIAKEYGKVSGRTSFEAAKKGDKVAQEVVDTYIKYVADGIASLVNIFQPEKIVIGGGISKEGDYILNPIKEYVEKNDYNKYQERTKIEIATLHNDAGIVGAAMAAKRAIG